MKHIILTLVSVLLCLLLTAQTNLDGGAGICHVSGDPDLNTDLQTQFEKDDCHLAYDRDAKTFYCYNPSQPQGQRWDAFGMAPNTVIQTCGTPIGPPPIGNYIAVDVCAISPIYYYVNPANNSYFTNLPKCYDSFYNSDSTYWCTVEYTINALDTIATDTIAKLALTPPAPIATCNDGIQNGIETGIDCGGSCSPCSSGGWQNCTTSTGGWENC